MLEPFEIIEGLFSLLYVATCMLVGILITSRYFKYKEKTFLFIGIASFGISVTHWASSISFLTNVIFDIPLPAEIFLFISVGFIAYFVFSWILGINNLLFEGKNKKFVMYIVVIQIPMIIVTYVIFFINPAYVGTVTAPKNLNARMIGIFILFAVINLLIILLTGLWASLRSMKSTSPLIKLKGRILFISFILWATGLVLDVNAGLDTIGVVIVRILLIFSSIGFYLGFVMPEIAQKFFKKIKLLKQE